MPLGVGGEKKIVTYAAYLKDGVEVLTDYTWENGANGSKSYTLADHPHIQGDMLTIFEQLRKRILNLDDTVREEIKKQYIAYKAATNFVDIEPQKKRLKLILNMPFQEIDDSQGLCKDVSGVGHYGNGDIEVGVASLAQLDDVMELIRQSFKRHQEDGDE
jgi:predicted transport protein